MSHFKEHPDGITFNVFVQPRSSKNMVSGLYGDALKIKLTAPPVDGAANKMCIQFFAKLFGVSKSSIEIIAGQSSRSKVLKVDFPKNDSLQKEKKRIIKLTESLFDA